MPTYQPDAYWETLLADQYDLSGVGHPDFPVVFNQALYAAMLDSVTNLMDAHRVDVAGRDVLEIGPGTGFWVRLWARLEAGSVTGVDISETAVRRLSNHFPDYSFRVDDLGARDIDWPTRYDVVSAMSVLLHIVDEERFRTALANIAAALQPHGVALLMEPLVLHRWWGPPFDATSNSKARHIDDWESALADAGLTLVEHRPVTALLNNVCDTRRKATWRLHQVYWLLIHRLLTWWPATSRRVLAGIRALDRRLVSRGVAPSAKVMLVRRAD